MNRRLALLAGWDGPDHNAYLNPCPGCDGAGAVADGCQVDVDDFIPDICGDCEGTGVAAEAEEEA